MNGLDLDEALVWVGEAFTRMSMLIRITIVDRTMRESDAVSACCQPHIVMTECEKPGAVWVAWRESDVSMGSGHGVALVRRGGGIHSQWP